MCMHYTVGDRPNAYQPDQFSDPMSNISNIKRSKHKKSDCLKKTKNKVFKMNSFCSDAAWNLQSN